MAAADCGDKAFYISGACSERLKSILGQTMTAQFFVAELSALQLPHWLMIAGGLLVVVGTVGALVSSRRRASAPEPSRGEATELQEQEPNSSSPWDD